ncbi:MAG: hypothetical protein ABSG04_05065 [Verrucomicrobiota bacterium]
MRNHISAFGSSLMLGFAVFVLPAQDTGAASAAARLAARRLAESGGAAAVPAADASATNTADAGTATATDTGMTNAADAGVTNAVITGATTNAAADPEEIARKARLAAAAKELQAAAKLPGSLVLLQNITQKNIFNPNRQPWTGDVPPPRQVVTETFTLRGTSEKKGKGFLAMFEGNGVPNFPPTRCVGDLINGYKIKAITETNVTVIDTKSTNNAEQVWHIPGEGQQGVTRTDGGPWKPAYYTPEYVSFSRPRQADAGLPGPSQFPMPQPMIAADTGPVAFTFGDTSGQDNSQGFNQRNRNRGGGGGGGNRRGGGGGNFGGGFGVGGNTQFAPPAPPPDPNAPIDPAVLARLRAQRAAEGQ